jgi:serine/threonine protein kinase
MIDYALQLMDEKVASFKKYTEVKVYTSGELHVKGKKFSVGDFIFMKCLGQGGSASVYLVRRKTNGKLYALKQIDKDYFIEFKRMEQILR